MVDLSREMADLISAFGPGPADRARVVGFVSALSGEGTSTVALEFARVAALCGRKPAWLINADLSAPALSMDDAFQERYGEPSREGRGSPNGAAFFTLTPQASGPDGGPEPDGAYLKASAVMDGRLWITRIQTDKIHPRQRLGLSADGAYFNALRPHSDYVVVDIPAADRSQAGLVLGPLCDGVVLVVGEDMGDARYAAGLKRLLVANGVNLLGMIYNHPPKAKAAKVQPSSPDVVAPSARRAGDTGIKVPFGQAKTRR